MSEEEPEASPEVEEACDDVEERTRAFVELGYVDYVAWTLAMNTHISVSQVRELIRHGCELDTAAAIVL